MEEMNKTQDPHGKIIIVSRFVSKHENNSGQGQLSKIATNMKNSYDNNIFIDFLSVDVTEDQLKAKFEQTGEILSIRLVRKQNRNHQSANIMYKEYSGAQQAIQKFHDSHELCGTRPLKVDYWISNEERKHEKEQHHQHELEKLLRQV